LVQKISQSPGNLKTSLTLHDLLTTAQNKTTLSKQASGHPSLAKATTAITEDVSKLGKSLPASKDLFDVQRLHTFSDLNEADMKNYFKESSSLYITRNAVPPRT